MERPAPNAPRIETVSDRIEFRTHMNEAETRSQYITPALRAAGWGVVDGSRIREEVEIAPGRLLGGQGKRDREVRADYVLEYRNTPLAVVEAKAWDQELTEGVGQAKNYAAKLAIRFTYSTNGQGWYGIDMTEGTEGELESFPSPQELWQRVFPTPEPWRDRFAAIPYPDKTGSWSIRYYQEIAVTRVLEAIAAERNRMLLTLATGTGKTSIAFQIAWKLFQARWNLSGQPNRRPRILFLADRSNLADQAFKDFTSFNAFEDEALVRIDPDSIRKRGRVPKNGSIFFTIFQTFMTGPKKDGKPTPSFGEYPRDFFDLIVIDECHRGGANDESTWRDILNYFSPAVQLGLTATPKRKDNVDTYRYFGEPLFTYSLKQGINDGFLTPFRVRQFQTTIDYYTLQPDDEVLEGEIEAGRVYKESDFNVTIEIREREIKRVELFLNEINPNEKTIVFCANQAHALLIRDLINQRKKSKNPGYCQRVTSKDGALGQEYLEQFQDNEKTIPTILTTSHKLSTGVDARNVRNIVLLREVKSMIEFKQIIGRGTRLHDGKDYFTLYDFVRAHLHFQDPEWDGEPIQPETCEVCHSQPCVCPPPTPQLCPNCGQALCVCPKEPCPECGNSPCSCPGGRRKVRVKLADGKARKIQHMAVTTFWHADGKPMSAQQFLESLFGKLPDFFQSETELRNLWSAPDTRARLLEGLAEAGYAREHLAEMQRLIEAENSDLFDVLAYVAYALPPMTRQERAEGAKVYLNSGFSAKQRAFLEFVLAHYVSDGVDELASEKLSSLLKLRYQNSMADAEKDLGRATEIRSLFSGFQRYLYQ